MIPLGLTRSTGAETLLAESTEYSGDGSLGQVLSSAPLYPRTDVVIVDLRTKVVIPDYSMYYNGPIQSFVPPYHALSDGSLVATPFITDVRGANLLLAVTSAAAMFFVINSLTVTQFLRRRRIRRMFLYYLLLASQVLGVVAMLTLMSTFFDQFTSCTV